MLEKDDTLASEATGKEDEDGARLESGSVLGRMQRLSRLFRMPALVSVNSIVAMMALPSFNHDLLTFLGAFVSSAGYHLFARDEAAGTERSPFPNCLVVASDELMLATGAEESKGGLCAGWQSGC